MCYDPKTRKTLEHASPISCDKTQQVVLVLELDKEEHYVATPNPKLRGTSMFCEPKQGNLQKARTHPLHTKEAGIFSKAEVTTYWNRVLITKHSVTALKLFGKIISIDILASSENHPKYFNSNSHRGMLTPAIC